jgi:two-component system C4-dicarboxylate transport response regulator DctD
MTALVQVILIDDEEEVLLSSAQTLELEDFAVTAFRSAEAVVPLIGADWAGVIVTDVKMPRMDGIELLQKILDIDPEIPVVLVTGHGDIAMAVGAIRRGAYDFIEKPASPEHLVDVVRRATEKRRLVLENRALRRDLDGAGELERRIIGRSPAMEALRALVANIASADVDVLVVGETGTGKELVARCLHDFSQRAAGPFVAINCGAMPEAIFESELFGHEAGTFTGAQKRRVGKIEFASGGTLFLDEIESMPLHLQVKMLRVLQERLVERLGGNEAVPVDIRVIAASKVDLVAAARRGEFRSDLYYRLNVASIALPPLRDHRDDIPLLFRKFLDAACLRHRRAAPPLSVDRLALLQTHDWPGNVRELKNAAERYALGLEDPHLAPVAPAAAGTELAPQMEAFEKQLIATTLRRHGGRVNETAADLGLPRKTLYLKMRRHGLDRADYR